MESLKIESMWPKRWIPQRLLPQQQQQKKSYIGMCKTLYLSIKKVPHAFKLAQSTTSSHWRNKGGFNHLSSAPKTCSRSHIWRTRKNPWHCRPCVHWYSSILKWVVYQLQSFFSSMRTLRPKLAFQGLTKLFMLTRRRPCLRSEWPATRYSTPGLRMGHVQPRAVQDSG